MVRVVFIHPDLGIGGAERLVIDAALALQEKGHDVCFLTAHHDPSHCFPETIDGSLKILCRGDWLPRSIFGYFCALWAYLRMIYLSLYLVMCCSINYDVTFVDQISACIPVLQFKRDCKVIFYCHYPDQLLTDRKSILKRIYRYFIDQLEERTTATANCILVNSNFTRKVFKETFKSIDNTPDVLYPSLDFKKFDSQLPSSDHEEYTFLSLNRYERKKNIGLALKAFKIMLTSCSDNKNIKAKLIIAGGYDDRVVENIQHLEELTLLAEELNISEKTTFLKSPCDKIKLSLFSQATCLLYTPANEHFGIVPIESMYAGTPVIAANSGGPLETVIDGETGFLREPIPDAFAEAMLKFVSGASTKNNFRKACRAHVEKKFSFEKFSSSLDFLVKSLIDGRKQR